MVDIELLSTGWTSSGSSALDRLEEIAKDSVWIKGVMAFFTHGNEAPLVKKKHLMERLKASDSYLCVGWNKPTNFEKIKTLEKIGVKFLVNVARISRSPKGVKKINDNLMHSKLLLFKRNDNLGYTIVIGSHNWTNRAIIGSSMVSGLNIEDSLILNCDENHDIVHACSQRIEHIKSQCIAYNPGIHRSLLALQDSEFTAKSLVFDELSLNSSPPQVLLSFASKREAEKFKQGTKGMLIGNKTRLAVNFESLGSWSSNDVSTDTTTRYISNWPGKILFFKFFKKGMPSPSKHLALLSLDYMGRKFTANVSKAGKKREVWRKIPSETYSLSVSEHNQKNVTIKHWANENGEPHPEPRDILPEAHRLEIGAIEQLNSYAIELVEREEN